MFHELSCRILAFGLPFSSRSDFEGRQLRNVSTDWALTLIWEGVGNLCSLECAVWDVWDSVHSLDDLGLVAAQLYILYNLNQFLFSSSWCSDL